MAAPVPQQTPPPAKPVAPKPGPVGARTAPPTAIVKAVPPPQPVEFPPAPIREECERILARYPTKMAALIPVLHVAQRHFGGWVSPAVEAGVAKWLGVGDGHVRGVLTFYAMFNTQPVGKHTVWVCRTLSCWLAGAPALTEAACRRAGVETPGQSGKDGKFFVREMECLGLCEVAPAAWIDGEVFGKVTPDDLVRRMDACK